MNTTLSKTPIIIVVILTSYLLQGWCEQFSAIKEKGIIVNAPNDGKQYDFIVIGAGPAGCTVANRLSEVSAWSVLLLEAGGEQAEYTKVPAAVYAIPFTGYDWGYRAERVEGGCLGIDDQRCPWYRGKGLGGTSIINFMLYTRGFQIDYDKYCADGNPGWCYEDVLKYFLKAEGCTIPELQSSPYHSTAGPLSVSHPPHRTALLDGYLEAGEELGYDRIVDYNDPNTPLGFSRFQATMYNGRRESANTAYLDSIRLVRRNLHISLNSFVTKILINDTTKVAYGVQYVQYGKTITVLAKREIVLSAGVFNSAQLLMLSGVGPEDHLREMNITCLRNSSVGKNLHDHYVTGGFTFLTNTTNETVKDTDLLNLALLLNYTLRGKGKLTLPGAVEAIGYAKTKYSDPSTPYPDMELIILSGSFGTLRGYNIPRKLTRITDKIAAELFYNVYLQDVWTIVPMPLHPKTVGRVKLASADPFVPPKLFFNYFEEEYDLKVLVEGVKLALRIAETKAMKKFGTVVVDNTLSNCSQHRYRSDEYWACYARHVTVSLWHHCGTCKMGNSSDPDAVVNHELKVYGIERLRVIDSSIFPDIPGAHLYAPTVMVGEKGADMIKETWLQ